MTRKARIAAPLATLVGLLSTVTYAQGDAPATVAASQPKGHPNRVISATPDYAHELPRSIVILPPLNHAKDLRGSDSVYPHLYVSLASKGYEVPPPSLVWEVLRANGVDDPGLVRELPLSKLAEVFGTDAAFFPEVKEYGSTYQIVQTKAQVDLRAQLVSLKSGRVLWEGEASFAKTDSDTSSLAAMLINALLTQVVNDAGNFARQVGAVAAGQLVWAKGLPSGPLCPEVGPKGTDCYRPLGP
jgi:hypothetical protein